MFLGVVVDISAVVHAHQIEFMGPYDYGLKLAFQTHSLPHCRSHSKPQLKVNACFNYTESHGFNLHITKWLLAYFDKVRLKAPTKLHLPLG